MNTRIEIEKLEIKNLSGSAALSIDTKGRDLLEEKCQFRTEYQRDRDRIIHSKAFRRLKHKTQVFISQEGDHFRTRLTHTLEVSQIARTIGRALALNEDLIEAIALGHDLGHTPFGHTGERILNKLNKEGFKHNRQSLRVVEILEYHENRPGLNLTFEVKDGILNHSGKNMPITLEGQVVRYADRIAYINHDIDDALRAGVLGYDELPREAIEYLGDKGSTRIDNMIRDVILNSKDDRIEMSPKCNEMTNLLRSFLFKNVYLQGKAKTQEGKAEYVIESLFNYYLKNIDDLSSFKEVYEGLEVTEYDKICDYIAGMTDRFVVNKFKEIFIPEPWHEF